MVSLSSSSVIGTPLTVVNLGIGTIWSPWPPRTSASTSVWDTPSAMETKALNLAASSTPPMPITLFSGNPVVLQQSCAITSMGLVTTITTAPGAYFLIASLTDPTTSALILSRSSLDMPGFRAAPAVMTTKSEPSISLSSLVPLTLTDTPQRGVASSMSRAFP